MADANETKKTKSGRSSGRVRLMSKDLNVYYSNCAMVATSPQDISLYYGRLVPASDDKGSQALAELYEKQIYMTFGQAEQVVKLLSQTLEAVKSGLKTNATPETSE